MMKQFFQLRILLCITLFFSACKKDKLTGDYDRIEGKYQWIYSSYSYRDCVLCTLKHRTDSAKDAAYTAQIKFDNTSCVTFYIDNAELTKKKFRIKEQSEDAGILYLELKVDVKKKDLDINDKLEVHSKNADTIYVSGFPGDGYDEAYNGQNYFVRIE